jgi:hypothetical protein
MLLGTSEEWKTIPFAPDYEVSSLGQVRSWMIWGGGGNGKSLKHPRLLRQSLKKKGKGYYGVMLVTKGGRKHFRVNRLVALVFIPNPENKPQVNHKDLIKGNNRIDNLEWALPVENVQHAITSGILWGQHGQGAKGERNAKAKLSEDEIREIRERWDCGCSTNKCKGGTRKQKFCPHGASTAQLASDYSVSQMQIQNIVRSKHWGHLDPNVAQARDLRTSCI